MDLSTRRTSCKCKSTLCVKTKSVTSTCIKIICLLYWSFPNTSWIYTACKEWVSSSLLVKGIIFSFRTRKWLPKSPFGKRQKIKTKNSLEPRHHSQRVRKDWNTLFHPHPVHCGYADRESPIFQWEGHRWTRGDCTRLCKFSTKRDWKIPSTGSKHWW